MLSKYYSLKTHREVLRQKGVSPGIDGSHRKHRSAWQRCQPSCILRSGAVPVAMKPLLLKFPFKGLLQKTLFFPNSPLPETAPFQASARPVQGQMRLRAVPDGTSAVPDGTQ